MDIIEARMNEILTAVFSYVQSRLGYTPSDTVSISLKIVLLEIIVIIIILASAFRSAQLAEKDKRNRLIHFLGGLFLVWIYPLFIYNLIFTAGKGKTKMG